MSMRAENFYNKHFAGPSGISEVWAIALPMVISSAFDVLVMFIDRMFLARVEPVQMAAMMTGGLTAFTAGTFFIGVISYNGTMVAHLYGAGRKGDCAKMTTQALLLSLISYPLVLLLIPVGTASFGWAGHSAAQIVYETEYFVITMLCATLFSLLRIPFSSFFAGIGSTRLVMFANLVGLLVNLLVAYLLIFGEFGFPKLGIRGAAIAVSVSSFANFLVLAYLYFRVQNRLSFEIGKSFVFERILCGRLIRFGFPSGMEFMISLSAFTTMVSMFHSYGENVAAAVTIAFNWDMIAFLPMVGLQIAVTALVGQNLGRKNEAGAIRATWSGFKLNLIYSGFMLLLFLTVPHYLVMIFAPSVVTPEWNGIYKMAVPMIMMMSIYPISDGMLIIFSGAIRGAGDTSWAMCASTVLHWGGAGYAWLLTHFLKLPPVMAWCLFVLVFPLFGLTFWLRFRSGKWKGRNLIPVEEPVSPAGELEPNPAIPNE